MRVICEYFHSTTLPTDTEKIMIKRKTTFDTQKPTEKPGYTVGYREAPPSSSAAIEQQRLGALRNFWAVMRNVRIMDDVRRARSQDALSGKTTFDDLSIPGIFLNGVPVSGDVIQSAQAPALANALPENAKQLHEEHLWEICNQTGITEQQYDEIDVEHKRRDLYSRFHAIFTDKMLSDCWANGVPEPLLLEELITTLNRNCIANSPFIYAAFATWEGSASTVDAAPNAIGKSNISVRCVTPHRVKVEISLKQQHLTGVAEGQVGYTLETKAVSPGKKVISYQNMHTTIIFMGTDADLSAKTLEEFRRDPNNSYHLSGNPPNVYPGKEGLVFRADIAGFYLDIKSMLSTDPVMEFVPLPSAIKPQTAVTRTHNRTPSTLSTIPGSMFASDTGSVRPKTNTQIPQKTSFLGHDDREASASSGPCSIRETHETVVLTSAGRNTRSNSQEQSTALQSTNANPTARATHDSLNGNTRRNQQKHNNVTPVTNANYADHSATGQSSGNVADAMESDIRSHEDSCSIWNTIREFFTQVGRVVQQLLVALRNLLFGCCINGKGNLSQSPGSNTSSDNDLAQSDSAQQRSPTGVQEFPDRQRAAPERKSVHTTASPSSNALSVNISPAVSSSNAQDHSSVSAH
ncbi:hypothetical protein ANPL_03345 [Anaplasma platys]|uniref:Uncharacterized protein n=1 Tax=Anaplasma platys TaxID=949 RepID=A0A858PYT0_9RICK|nr:hypothetical protein [Anaplasma platys]QJC27727.1 hypothetical protein ANPL_03345 [Anaplasma platys]